MFTLHECPFCAEKLSKEQMKYHVGIPLCMEMRKQTQLSKEIPSTIGTSFNIPISELSANYFGTRGYKELIAYTITRCTYGHPDEKLPINLESFVDHSEDAGFVDGTKKPKCPFCGRFGKPDSTTVLRATLNVVYICCDCCASWCVPMPTAIDEGLSIKRNKQIEHLRKNHLSGRGKETRS